MKLISHRGNINGPSLQENHPKYVLETLNKGFNCEIDIRYIDGILFLGHNLPQYEIKEEFIHNDKLWLHCKTIETLKYLKNINFNGIYFWHQNDDIALTSNNYLWTYPGKSLTEYSIAVMPETCSYKDKEIKNCYGICSDYIINYKNI